MESTAHHTKVTHKVWQPEQPYFMSLPPHNSSPNSPPKRVLFDYVLRTRTCKIIRPCDFPNVNHRDVFLGNPQILNTTHEIVHSDTLLSSPNETRQIIVANLCELLRNGPRVEYEPIVNDIVSFSQIACHNVFNAGRETIRVRVTIEVLLVSIIHEWQLIQRFADTTADPAADTSYGMVPASKKSIRDLESKKLSGSSESPTICVVCLEELTWGAELKCMPCSHMFHEECITSWLETSHHCPVCRFEMPTEDEDR